MDGKERIIVVEGLAELAMQVLIMQVSRRASVHDSWCGPQSAGRARRLLTAVCDCGRWPSGL